jgi:hypothetical protein
VILFAWPIEGVVPMDQVVALREGIENVLLASQLTFGEHGPGPRHVRQSARDGDHTAGTITTYLNYVNDRAL